MLLSTDSIMKVYEEREFKSNVRKRLRKNTTIKVSDEGILTITVEDRDPNRAAAMANSYVEELDRQNKRLSAGRAASKRIFLENRLKEIEQELTKIEDLLSRETKIKEMLFELLMRQCELAKIEEAKSMPTIQVLDEATVPEMRMPRGTVKKTALAGSFSLMLAILAAFAREYIAKVEAATKEQEQLWFTSKRRRTNDVTFDELESKRRTITARSIKRVRRDQPYSPKA
jgi:uncharacterized protein involved in exopolysaccharide biosynthesis